MLSRLSNKPEKSSSSGSRSINYSDALSLSSKIENETAKLRNHSAAQTPASHFQQATYAHHLQGRRPNKTQIETYPGDPGLDLDDEVIFAQIDPEDLAESESLDQPTETMQNYILELRKDLKIHLGLQNLRNQEIGEGNKTASRVIRGLQGLFQAFNTENNHQEEADFLFDHLYKIANKNVYQDTGRRYGADSLIACKNENNYLVAQARYTYSYIYLLFRNSETPIEHEIGIQRNHENPSQLRILDSIYTPGRPEFEIYYLKALDKLYYIAVSPSGDCQHGVAFDFHHSISIGHNEQWFGHMRYSAEIQSLFMLTASQHQRLEIRILTNYRGGWNPQVYQHHRISDRDPTGSGFIWFDFIAGDHSRLLAVTKDLQCTVIDYNHQRATSRLSDYFRIPQIGQRGLEVREAGPFCLSSNGKFFLIRANRQTDVLYELTLQSDQHSRSAPLLKFLGYFQAPVTKKTFQRVLYSEYDVSDKRVEFLVVDGPNCRILTWCGIFGSIKETGRNQFEVVENVLQVKDGNYSNLCRVGSPDVYLMCDYLGRVAKIRVRQIPK